MLIYCSPPDPSVGGSMTGQLRREPSTCSGLPPILPTTNRLREIAACWRFLSSPHRVRRRRCSPPPLSAKAVQDAERCQRQMRHYPVRSRTVAGLITCRRVLDRQDTQESWNRPMNALPYLQRYLWDANWLALVQLMIFSGIIYLVAERTSRCLGVSASCATVRKAPWRTVWSRT